MLQVFLSSSLLLLCLEPSDCIRFVFLVPIINPTPSFSLFSHSYVMILKNLWFIWKVSFYLLYSFIIYIQQIQLFVSAKALKEIN